MYRRLLTRGSAHKPLVGIVAAGLLVGAFAVWRFAGRTIEVDVDGGTFDVAVLGDVVIPVRPGQTVLLRHAGELGPDGESPITHAFVGPRDEPPPLFAPQAGGLTPTPVVWGPCHAGDPDEIVAVCPAPSEEADRWDGESYWSTGAMVPSETRAIPLADDISQGDHVLTCAFHPDLRLVLRVGGEGSPLPNGERAVDAARAAVEDEAEGSNVVVTAGLEVDGAYVAAFSPRVVRVPVGGSVTWRAGARTPVDVVFGAAADHEDERSPSLAHTVPTDGVPAGRADAWDGKGELRSGFLSADPAAGATAREWSVTFTGPGTYTYVSRFGSAMIGTVVVGKGGE